MKSIRDGDGEITISVRGSGGRSVVRTFWLPAGEISAANRDELIYQVKALYWDRYGKFPHAAIIRVDVEAWGPYGPIKFPEVPKVTIDDYLGDGSCPTAS
jgi:hypothetical protein